MNRKGANSLAPACNTADDTPSASLKSRLESTFKTSDSINNTNNSVKKFIFDDICYS